jgi:hypothetical protein
MRCLQQSQGHKWTGSFGDCSTFVSCLLLLIFTSRVDSKLAMKASILLGIVFIGSCINGSTAYGFFGGSDQDSKTSKIGNPQAAPFKLDYKLSFKKPYYYNNTIPFWQTTGGMYKIHGRQEKAISCG